jgi:hypothetical protein
MLRVEADEPARAGRQSNLVEHGHENSGATGGGGAAATIDAAVAAGATAG